jgi:hypothetical protein
MFTCRSSTTLVLKMSTLYFAGGMNFRCTYSSPESDADEQFATFIEHEVADEDISAYLSEARMPSSSSSSADYMLFEFVQKVTLWCDE